MFVSVLRCLSDNISFLNANTSRCIAPGSTYFVECNGELIYARERVRIARCSLVQSIGTGYTAREKSGELSRHFEAENFPMYLTSADNLNDKKDLSKVKDPY